MPRWLWVTRPDVYTTKPLRVHDHFTWTCHPDAKSGDIALLYRAYEPFQDFSHVFRMKSDPSYHPDLAKEFRSDTGCDCALVAALQCPVLLGEARADPVLSKWHAAQVNFQGTAFPLDQGVWDAFLNLTDPLDTQHLRGLP